MLDAVRLRIDLAYDGTGFYGWAKQPEIRTVQGEIERVLHTILRVPEGDPTEPLRLTVAGRTDTGVHASHQVCHLDIGEETLSRCVGHMSVPPIQIQLMSGLTLILRLADLLSEEPSSVA